MNREIVRAEPPSTYLENWNAPIERPTELVMEQLKLCVETAGSSMDEVLKCNVHCTSVTHFGTVNEIYARYFATAPHGRPSSLCPPGLGASTSR